MHVSLGSQWREGSKALSGQHVRPHGTPPLSVGLGGALKQAQEESSDHTHNLLKTSSRASFYAVWPSVIIHPLSLGWGEISPTMYRQVWGAGGHTHSAQGKACVPQQSHTPRWY